MSDPFAQFGGEALEPEKVQKQDPFAQFGGQAESTDTKQPDPFAEFQGEAETPERESKAGLFKTDYITKEDIDRIKKETGITDEQAEELWKVRGYLGAITPQGGPAEVGRQLIGIAGRSLGLGIPQFVYKKLQDDPKFRAAIDELNEEIESRMSVAQQIGEIGAGIGGAIGLAGKAAKIATGTGKTAKAAKWYEPASAITSGATMGLTSAKEGEELEETVKGAAIGAGAATIAFGVPAAYRAMERWSDDVMRKAIKEAEEVSPKIEERVDEIVKNQQRQIKATKTALQKLAKSESGYQEFLEAVPTKVRESMISKADVERIMADANRRKAIRALLGKRKLTDEDVRDAIAYGKWAHSKKLVEHAAGGRKLEELASESQKFLNDTYEQAMRADVAQDVLTDLKVRDRLPKFNPLQRAAIWFSDGKFVAKIFDDKLGTNLEQIYDRGSKQLNRYTDLIKEPLSKSFKLATRLRESGESMDDVYKQLDSGNATSEVAKQYQEFFEEVRQLANKADIGVQRLGAGYVPKYRKPIAEYLNAFKQEANRIAEELKVRSLRELTPQKFDLARKQSGSFARLVDEMEQVGGGKINNVADFAYHYKNFLQNPAQVRGGLNTIAAALKQRKDGVPEWALDRNVPRLASRWVQNTFRYGALRDTLRDLRLTAKKMSDAGDDFAAEYVRNGIADLLGTRAGTFAGFSRDQASRLQALANRKAEASTNPLAKRLWQGLEDFPDIISKIQQQVYPNYLGLNPKSALQNLTSFYLQNVPEIGAGLGTKITLEAMADMAKFKKQGGDIGEMIYRNGVLPRQWTAEMVEAVREGARSSSALGDISRKALDKYTNAMMYAFTKSEIFARGMTHFIAKRLSNNLMENPKVREQVLQRMTSSSYRRSFQKLIKEGNADKLAEQVEDYLQSTNMFNYDRLNMSEYGRSMGPLFSVFSKWPTATAGKLAHYYMNGVNKDAIVRSTQVLAMPMFTLYMVDKLMAPEPGESDTYDRIIGKKGLRGWTMADSIPTDIGIREGLLSTPIVAATADLFDAVQEDNSEKALRRWFNNSMRSFAPGAGFVRFLGEDIPLFIEGKKQPRTEFIPED